MAQHPCAHRPDHLQRGYTLVELVVVIVLLGVMALVLVGNDDSRRQQGLQIQAERLRRDLSHLQLQAMAKGLRVVLRVSAGGTGYTPLRCLNDACTLTAALAQDADGSSGAVVLTDGVQLSASAELVFDSLGRPLAGTGLRTTALTYGFSATGLSSVQVVVQPLTGLARVPA